MDMHYERRGSSKLLLLLHGIGGSWQSWSPILDALAKHREVIAVDLPGHGNTPPLTGEVSIPTIADAVTAFLQHNNWLGIDTVGSSMGARLALELVRRGGVLGAVVSLDPGGFWKGWEISYFYYTIALSIRLVRALQPVMHAIAYSPIGRSLLLIQFATHPAKLPPLLVLTEMRSYASSLSFDELLQQLACGEKQQGLPSGFITKTLVIGWGTKDRVCFPKQARRANRVVPGGTTLLV